MGLFLIVLGALCIAGAAATYVALKHDLNDTKITRE